MVQYHVIRIRDRYASIIPESCNPQALRQVLAQNLLCKLGTQVPEVSSELVAL